MSIRDDVMSALEKLPPDATEDDVLYQIYVVLKIDRGLAAARAGDKVSLEEARERIKNWPK
jgi:predicted transcriptional regulator